MKNHQQKEQEKEIQWFRFLADPYMESLLYWSLGSTTIQMTSKETDLGDREASSAVQYFVASIVIVNVSWTFSVFWRSRALGDWQRARQVASLLDTGCHITFQSPSFRYDDHCRQSSSQL